MLIDSYHIACRCAKYYSYKYPHLNADDYIVEIAMKYQDFNDSACTMATAINRAFAWKMSNEQRRRLTTLRQEGAAYKEYADPTVRFYGLSPAGKLLLKHMKLVGVASQWNVYLMLKKRGWSWSLFMTHLKELKEAYYE